MGRSYSATICVLAEDAPNTTLRPAIVFRSCERFAMNRSRFAAIILAAGEGTRLNSARPKVLHEIAGEPMIGHVLAALRPLEPAETVVVLGRGMEAGARAVAPVPTLV